MTGDNEEEIQNLLQRHRHAQGWEEEGVGDLSNAVDSMQRADSLRMLVALGGGVGDLSNAFDSMQRADSLRLPVALAAHSSIANLQAERGRAVGGVDMQGRDTRDLETVRAYRALLVSQLTELNRVVQTTVSAIGGQEEVGGGEDNCGAVRVLGASRTSRGEKGGKESGVAPAGYKMPVIDIDPAKCHNQPKVDFSIEENILKFVRPNRWFSLDLAGHRFLRSRPSSDLRVEGCSVHCVLACSSRLCSKCMPLGHECVL